MHESVQRLQPATETCVINWQFVICRLYSQFGLKLLRGEKKDYPPYWFEINKNCDKSFIYYCKKKNVNVGIFYLDI